MVVKIVQLDGYEVEAYGLDPAVYYNLRSGEKMDALDKKANQQQMQQKILKQLLESNSRIQAKREKYARKRKERDQLKLDQKKEKENKMAPKKVEPRLRSNTEQGKSQ